MPLTGLNRTTMELSLVRPRCPISLAVNRCIFSLAITLHSTLTFCLIYPCVLTTVFTNTRTVSAAMPYSNFSAFRAHQVHTICHQSLPTGTPQFPDPPAAATRAPIRSVGIYFAAGPFTASGILGAIDLALPHFADRAGE